MNILRVERNYKFSPTDLPTVLTFETYCRLQKKVIRNELVKAIHLYFDTELKKSKCKKLLEASIKEVSKAIGTEKIIEDINSNRS